jgi:4-amino-4-deoxy-L-arabinose transferase-like glycosyltransferase
MNETLIRPQRFVFVFVLLFAGLVLIQSITRRVVDWDEIVYLQLSERMTWTFGNYTTRGTATEGLPSPVYQAPVFQHPPLIPLIIKVFSTFLPPVGAARLMTTIFYALLLWVLFALAEMFSNTLGGVIALGLASLCPIINMEARLIHIDLPMTVFLLLGSYLCLSAGSEAVSVKRLAASGAMFAAAFLCKYSGPLFLPIPIMLFVSQRERYRGGSRALAFFCPLALGFAWWIVIACRFGSLAPKVFALAGVPPFTAYLRSVAQRHWYHLVLYFLALCPIAAIYFVKPLTTLWRRREAAVVASERNLLALNIAAWICAIVLGYGIAAGNSYWYLRYFLPLVAIIYITLGCISSRILLQGNANWNSYLVALMMFTAFVMTWSTATSVNLPGNLKPIPVLLFWLGLGKLFH